MTVSRISRRPAAPAPGLIVNFAMFVVIAVLGGLGSSWYLIEKGSRLTTHRSGPWVAWTGAGRSDADPYTRAHFLRRGMLPVSSTVTLTYQATTDSDGQGLYSSCDYAIEGQEPPAAFWSLAVFDENGALIPNPADRYSFNSATVMRPTSGRLEIRLARNARPGNWLPTGGAGRLALVFTIEELQGTAADQSAKIELPPIKRLACR